MKRSGPPSLNRRRLQERRLLELGPPYGWRERRLKVERRLPAVEENALSHSEWLGHYVAFIARRRARKAPPDQR
ncbi:hypothetical protein [Dechloromonas denitrificans]|uniref:hypothetical protein n=1 Tax=Dechloromonas denitrificans TaxID=281362 RepID=UPI001CFAC1BF|nr:hypothetical protein [Dechloromonas denitrificans]UCV08243.1 hypothetical protein KI615_01555 [Dechloromonas denitrificans]